MMSRRLLGIPVPVRRSAGFLEWFRLSRLSAGLVRGGALVKNIVARFWVVAVPDLLAWQRGLAPVVVVVVSGVVVALKAEESWWLVGFKGDGIGESGFVRS